MQTTKKVLGASRLPLTSKRANKDYYKGTRQSYVPGGGAHRTGPPGVHLPHAKAKYRIEDSRVRYYVGPGAATLDSTELKPYVSALPLDHGTRASLRNLPALPAFQPIPFSPLASSSASSSSSTSSSTSAELPKSIPPEVQRGRAKVFSKRYAKLREDEKQALIMEARRQWWEGLRERHGKKEDDAPA